jgi:hypothetical protein
MLSGIAQWNSWGEPMNGVHDLGGLHGCGRIERDAEERVFHARTAACAAGQRDEE